MQVSSLTSVFFCTQTGGGGGVTHAGTIIFHYYTCVEMLHDCFLLIHRLHIPNEVVVTEKDVTAFTYRDTHGRDIPIEGLENEYIPLNAALQP